MTGPYLNLEAFAPAAEWEEVSCAAIQDGESRENRHDL